MALRTWWEFSAVGDEEEPKTRKGPWTVQEDMQLIRYISSHGEGRWPFLAKAAGMCDYMHGLFNVYHNIENNVFNKDFVFLFFKNDEWFKLCLIYKWIKKLYS